MTEVVRIAMVGCGGMMGAHCRGYKLLWEAGIRSFSLDACCDINEENAKRMADEIEKFQGTRPRLYPSLEKMLKAEKDLTAVDISTQHRVHHKLAVQAMECGLHVTIEKPLAITMRAGKLMLDTAKATKRILQVAENYRRSPENRAVNWALEQKRLGRLRMIFWIGIGERVWYWNWREHVAQAGGGWTLDGGVHYADLFRYHIGDVKTIFSQSKRFHPYRYKKPETLEEPIKVDVEDTTISVLEFENGVSGQWTSTSAAPGKGTNWCAIYGEHGSIVFGQGLKTRKEELTTQQLIDEFMGAITADEKEKLFPHGITDTCATELKEFIDAVSHGTKLETDGLEGYKALAICFGVYESSALGKPVEIRQIESLKIESYQDKLNRSLRLK